MLESSVAVQELDLAINRSLNGRLTAHRKKFVLRFLKSKKCAKIRN